MLVGSVADGRELCMGGAFPSCVWLLSIILFVRFIPIFTHNSDHFFSLLYAIPCVDSYSFIHLQACSWSFFACCGKGWPLHGSGPQKKLSGHLTATPLGCTQNTNAGSTASWSEHACSMRPGSEAVHCPPPAGPQPWHILVVAKLSVSS